MDQIYKIKEFQANLQQKLMAQTEASEAALMATWLLEYYLDVSRTDILLNRLIEISKEEQQKIQKAVDRLNDQEPIQYVLGEAHFYGRTFMVSPEVLIPRRETEELMVWIKEENASDQLRVLDIGTGSGCIAVTLSLMLSRPNVYGLDISESALQVATQNAAAHGADVTFWKHDVLSNDALPLKPFDIIVSNPPYVRRCEAQFMSKRVTQYEPESALFVEDQHPLLFYEQMIHRCQQEKWLAVGGRIYWEINEVMADKLLQLLYESRFEEIVLRKDMQGKHRFVTGKLVE